MHLLLEFIACYLVCQMVTCKTVKCDNERQAASVVFNFLLTICDCMDMRKAAFHAQ